MKDRVDVFRLETREKEKIAPQCQQRNGEATQDTRVYLYQLSGSLRRQRDAKEGL